MGKWNNAHYLLSDEIVGLAHNVMADYQNSDFATFRSRLLELVNGQSEIKRLAGESSPYLRELQEDVEELKEVYGQLAEAYQEDKYPSIVLTEEELGRLADAVIRKFDESVQNDSLEGVRSKLKEITEKKETAPVKVEAPNYSPKINQLLTAVNNIQQQNREMADKIEELQKRKEEETNDSEVYNMSENSQSLLQALNKYKTAYMTLKNERNELAMEVEKLKKENYLRIRRKELQDALVEQKESEISRLKEELAAYKSGQAHPQNHAANITALPAEDMPVSGISAAKQPSTRPSGNMLVSGISASKQPFEGPAEIVPSNGNRASKQPSEGPAETMLVSGISMAKRSSTRASENMPVSGISAARQSSARHAGQIGQGDAEAASGKALHQSMNYPQPSLTAAEGQALSAAAKTLRQSVARQPSSLPPTEEETSTEPAKEARPSSTSSLEEEPSTAPAKGPRRSSTRLTVEEETSLKPAKGSRPSSGPSSEEEPSTAPAKGSRRSSTHLVVEEEPSPKPPKGSSDKEPSSKPPKGSSDKEPSPKPPKASRQRSQRQQEDTPASASGIERAKKR